MADLGNIQNINLFLLSLQDWLLAGKETKKKKILLLQKFTFDFVIFST